MKLDIDIIKAPIDKHLDEFDRQFKASMKSSVPLLDIITRYIVKRKGKANTSHVCFLLCRIMRRN